MTRGAADRRPLRVAIIGVGPKGLFALERLLDHAHRSGPECALELDLYEPHPAPGAGPAYDPRQPEYLRMNFAAELLDLWPAGSRAMPDRERSSFVDWRRRAGIADERYPPRAIVGRYLADGFTGICRHAPPEVRITRRQVAVRGIEQLDPTAWRVETGDGQTRDHDELLLTTGHRGGGDRWPAGAWEHAAPLVPAVFPAARRLDHEHVAPGATVAVRGFALTFLDAALALTEGRGGAFEYDRQRGRLRYEPSGAEPAALLPFSRSGRPMLVKPDPELAAGVPVLATIAGAGSAMIAEPAPAADPLGNVVAVLASCAGASLLAANGRRPGSEALRTATAAAGAWLSAALRGEAAPDEVDPRAELERSLQVGAGLSAPDLAWALGHSWRSVYPAIVARLGGSGLPDHAWPAFRALAAQMERVAFGPPAVNVAKLLALIAAGRVDLTHVRGGLLCSAAGVTSIRSADRGRRVDVVVNAVLAPPGATDDAGLLQRLVADGHARVRVGRRGLDTGHDGGCVARDGHGTPGLAAVGRPTEDSVIGNDTLSRTLHPQADRWARRVAARAAQSPRTAALPREAA